MKKRSRKLISILLTLALLATLLVPMATPAAASSTYSVNSVQSVSANTTYNVGTFSRITMEIAPGSLSVGQAAYMRMSIPVDFTTNAAISAPAFSSGTNLVNGGLSTIRAIGVAPTREYEIMVVGANSADKGLLYIDLSNFTVPSGKSGDVKVSFDAAPGTPLSSGSVVIAQIGSGIVTLAMDDINTLTTAGGAIASLQVKEDRAGALANSTKAIKLKLPNGFSWAAPGNGQTSEVYGDAAVDPALGANFTLEDSNRTLVIANPKAALSSAATYFKINALSITVDESVAKVGDVKVTVSGDSSFATGELVVAKLGDYGITVSAFGDPKDVRTGRQDEEVGKFAIEESVAGSLVGGRTLTLQLTGGAVWRTFPTVDGANSKNQMAFATPFATVGSDNATIKATITASASAAKYVLEKGTIDVSAAAGPEIKIIVGGTAGATGEVLVGKTVKVVKVSVDKAADVIAGMQNQAIPDVIIEEAKAEAIAAGNLRIEFPVGIFPSLANVEVIEGDLVINKDSVSRAVTNDGRWSVDVTVRSTSSTPSKVKFSKLSLKVDRDVAEGPIAVAVKGALNAAAAQFPGYTSVAAGVVANVVTPASGDVKTGAAFVIGSTKYKVGAVEKEMDVAPYVKDGRTFLPVRYVAESLGVATDNILWDEANQTVTLLKGDKVVQVKIGSKAMIVNGATITMDVAAEITSGRTMLPFRFIAQALGASVTWDDATQTVTLK